MIWIYTFTDGHEEEITHIDEQYIDLLVKEHGSVEDIQVKGGV